MFGLFKSKKSAIRQALEASIHVRGTWFEWCVDGDALVPELIVEFTWELDPKHPDFYRDGLEALYRIVKAAEPPVPKVRIIPARARD